MTPQPHELAALAHKTKAANKDFFVKLKKRTPNAVDDAFHGAHEQVFGQIDCLSCANCCKTTSPIFYERDIDRLAKALNLRPVQFIERFLRIDEDKDYVLKQSPCPFLDGDNYCSVYTSRPTACREYPHTNRKRMHQILELTFKNVSVCPAVYAIVEKLKEEPGQGK